VEFLVSKLVLVLVLFCSIAQARALDCRSITPYNPDTRMGKAQNTGVTCWIGITNAKVVISWATNDLQLVHVAENSNSCEFYAKYGYPNIEMDATIVTDADGLIQNFTYRNVTSGNVGIQCDFLAAQ
jgi:hypothetical protein